MRMNIYSSWRRYIAAMAASTMLSTAVTAPVLADGGNTKTPIKHVVVIFLENISFDHYFGITPRPRTRATNRALSRGTTRRR